MLDLQMNEAMHASGPATRLQPGPRAWIWILTSGAIGAFVFLLRFGNSVANPFDVSWIGTSGDLFQHYLSWCFFRLEAWHWPPSRIDALFAPLGTTVGLTDGIPLAALLLKPLAGANGPDFQYLGPWLILNHVLQGMFAAAIAVRLIPGKYGRLFLIGVMLLAPPFLARYGHIALSSHWLLLWALYVYLFARRKCLGICAPLMISALVHPYLTFMVMALAVPSILRDSDARPRAVVVRFALLAVLTLSMLYVGGTFDPTRSLEDYGETGFGYYSANLLTAIDGDEWALLGPQIPNRRMQYEGFNYLGLGLIVLIACLVARPSSRSIIRDLARRHRPLLLVLAGLTLLAISNRIMLGSVHLTSIGLPDQVQTLLSPFRSSGRFLWPVWYVVVAGSVIVAWRSAPIPGGRNIWFALLALQVVDLSPLWAERVHYTTGDSSASAVAAWAPFVADADTLQTYPPLASYVESREDALLFTHIALRHQIPVTTAYVARRPHQAVEHYRVWLRQRLLSTVTPRSGERVVIRSDSLGIFMPSLQGRYHLYRLGQYWIASGEEIEGFSEELPAAHHSE
jgi:hypothetical protein